MVEVDAKVKIISMSTARNNTNNNVKEIYNIFVYHSGLLRNKQFNFLKVILDNRQEKNLNKLRHK